MDFLKSIFTALATPLLLCLGTPLSAQNVAQGKIVTTSAPTWSTLPASNIVDGNVTTISHPLSATPSGFYYQIDLARDYDLTQISVVNRGDNCCPERLTNYRVSLYADNAGAPGTLNWETIVRPDGTNSGVGGTDVVISTSSTNVNHVMKGRFLRISNVANGAYNPQIAEVIALPLDLSGNLALGKPATSSGATWAGQAASTLTDGNPLSPSFSHPAAGQGLGFYYQVDLGSVKQIGRLVIRNRDTCCPERLSNYRVSLLDFSGSGPGAVLWQADIRADGTNSGMGGADEILATASTNAAHVFRGRYIRVENISGMAYNPQVAEIQAFPPPPPTVRSFTTTAGNLGLPGGPTQATLAWTVTNADSVTISGLGPQPVTGSVNVSPTAALTTYTLTATKVGIGTSTAELKIAYQAAAVPPRINEFQAADGILEDDEGDRVDWIEIYNPNPFTLNLERHGLTDQAAIPAQWTFPLTNVPPGGYFLVYASGKNCVDPLGQLHTNFSLRASGDYLALHSPEGNLLQSFAPSFPRQYDRSSYGLDSSGQAKFFRPSSPGQVNGQGYSTAVADTVFSIHRGHYTTPQTIAITSATPGAQIRYTTDGVAPTPTTGTVYTQPITISTSTVIRAIAHMADGMPTNVDTHTYLFLAGVPNQATMAASTGPVVNGLASLPSISVVTPSSIAQENPVLCSFEYLPTATEATTHGMSAVQEYAGIELFGGEFTDFQKKNFRLSFKSEFGATTVRVPGLFARHAADWKPVEKFGQLELRGGSHDMVSRGFSMANAFTDALMLEGGAFSVHSRFVHLYLNGIYWGVYHLRERWNAEHHAAYFGGPKAAHESINGNYNVGGWADPGDVYDGDGSAWLRLKNLRGNPAAVQPYLDIPQFIDYMGMWMFGHSEDEYRTTGPSGVGSGFKFFLNDSDGYLSTTPWDGNANNTVRGAPAGRAAGDGPGGLLSALWASGNADFRMLLADRLHRQLFTKGVLSPEANAARLNKMCDEVDLAMHAEAARWAASGTTRTYASWLAAKQHVLTNFFPTRNAVHVGHLQATGYYPTITAPAFQGGPVAVNTVVNFSVAGSTVYHTTDGSDPRLPGGAVNPSALTTATHTVVENVWLRARAWNGTAWSALNEAYYEVAPLAPGDVLISEIHYNAQGDDDTEFLELWNPTPRSINLRGAKFLAGIDFAFPTGRDTLLAPGKRLVISPSVYAFQQRYGVQLAVPSTYFDRLGNDGDTIILANASNQPLHSLQYQDTAPWPTSADGDGWSLTLANAAQPSLATSWRTSVSANGTPGTVEAAITTPAQPNADTDGDGQTNLVEWMLGSNATTPGASPMAISTTQDGIWQVTFPRRLNADNVNTHVECSSDLNAWIPLEHRISHVNTGNGFAQETWAIEQNTERIFVRIRFDPK